MNRPAHVIHHPLLRSSSIRRVESAALAETAPGELMSRAANAVARAAERHLRKRPAGCPVIAFCGPGNNGGDALLATLLLHEQGFHAQAFELAGSAGTSVRAADALRVRAQAAQAGLVPARIESPEALQSLLERFAHPPQHAPLILDGLFGIGLARALDGLAARLCELLDALHLPVIAIDVPSGIDADTGAIVGGPAGAAIRAVETVTMIADKPGLHTARALDHAGHVNVASLGLAAKLEGAADGELFGRAAAAALLPARPRDSSKGSFGSVLVIGGAGGMHGAALLAALGAQHGGAGKVWIAAPGAPVFDPGQPQLMTRDPDASFEPADVLVAGCGLGTDQRAAALLARVLESRLPAVLDADALNLLAGAGAGSTLASRAGAGLLAARENPHPDEAGPDTANGRVLTPHPLEAARLLRCSAAGIQADRIGSACTLTRAFGAVVALKGAGTVVAAPDGRWAIIDSGGPALASAGTGDVLAGLIGSLIAQQLPPFEAALLACWAHGDAADRWTEAQGRGAGLSAAELPILIRQSLAFLESCRADQGRDPALAPKAS